MGGRSTGVTGLAALQSAQRTLSRAEDRFSGTRSRGNVSVKRTGLVGLHLRPAQRPGQPHQVTASGSRLILPLDRNRSFSNTRNDGPFQARTVDQRRTRPDWMAAATSEGASKIS
jgi:hypothetical protein